MTPPLFLLVWYMIESAVCVVRRPATWGSLLGLFFVLVLWGVLGSLACYGQSQPARARYVEQYKDLAVRQMQRHGVPASIILAQGLLESGNGQSELARKANNHFGIKCHRNWEGGRTYHDDDARGECFRVYRSVEQSYEDHSLFLRGGQRYAFLFNLDPTDYKGWAHGLKKAGYATDPGYAKRLIRIIEEENLAQYDRGVDVEVPVPQVNMAGSAPGEGMVVQLRGNHEVMERNRVKYVVVQPHDTYASLTEELEMFSWEIARYNELPRRALPPVGSVVYLQPKRRKADVRYPVHTVEAGESLYDISQQYAVKMKHLAKRNHLRGDESLEPGQVIYLRKRAPLR